MPLRTDDAFGEPTVSFLKQAYRFVNREWQHIERESSPDQGFEARFRESCVKELKGWTVSQQREMGLGLSYETASGTLHEIDIVASTQNVTAVAELKHRLGTSPDKNDVIVFFAKLVDYVAAHPSLAAGDLCPAFMCPLAFEVPTLATCLGLGIHPAGPNLRPLPVLVDSVRLMEVELNRGLRIIDAVQDRLDDMVALINSVSLTLQPTWLSSRWGFYSDDAVLVRAVSGLDVSSLARQFASLNFECSALIREFSKAKSSVG